MPGQAFAYATGTAAMANPVIIPGGKRPYLISIVTGVATASLVIEGFAAITIPANASFSFGGEDFPNGYVGPISVNIGGTPTSWVVAWGDPETDMSYQQNLSNGGWPPNCFPP